MDAIREYLIGVVAAALLCGIITTLIDGKSTIGTVIKLIAGFLMLLAVLRPWTSIRPEGLFQWAESISADGSVFAADGESVAKDFYRESIKQQLEAYILDEANAYGCDLTVEVILSEEELAVPAQVRLRGEASPYARQVLTNLLTEKLGLKREDLIWA